MAADDKCFPDGFPVCELHRTPSCEQTWNQSEQLVHWKLVCCVAPPIGNLPASEDWMDANGTLGVPETRATFGFTGKLHHISVYGTGQDKGPSEFVKKV